LLSIYYDRIIFYYLPPNFRSNINKRYRRKDSFYGRRDDINLTKEIKEIKRFVKELDTPSKEEIDKLELASWCMEGYRKYGGSYEKVPRNAVIAAISRVPLPERIYIRLHIKGICNWFERKTKERAYEIVEKINSEKNPFLILIYEDYLNMLVECSKDILTTTYGVRYGGLKCIKESTSKQLIEWLEKTN